MVDKAYKARLVAKVFHPTIGFDFNEMFNSIVKPTTIRAILTQWWIIRQLDINNVFLNGIVQFMEQPTDFVDPKKYHLFCEFHKEYMD